MKKFIVSILTVFFLANIAYAETVVFNTKTHKYHNLTCSAAAKCTVNCIKLEKQQAKAKGGIPCKICGG